MGASTLKKRIGRSIFLLCATLLLAPFAAAQFTIVSGTVKDVNGLAYAGGTISASLVVPGGCNPTLNGVGFTGSMSPIGLDPTGSFTARLADNNVINCGGTGTTSWKFLVNITGVPLPLGTGPQTCTATLTITGASQSISSSFAACPALSNSSGGITSGAVLPATCTPGGANAIFQLSVPPYTVFRCGPGVNQFSLDSTPPNTFDPFGFGAKGDVFWVFTATTTLNSGVVSVTSPLFCNGGSVACTTGLINVVNKIGYITCCGTGGLNHVTSVLVNPNTQTHFTVSSVQSTTQITVSTNSNANNTNATLILGTQDDTTAINNMATAAWAGPNCSSVYLTGAFFISNAVLNAPASCNNGLTAPSRTNAVVRGNGGKSTLLVLLPDFWANANSTNCAQVVGTFNSCIFSGTGLALRSIGIWGGEYGNTGNHLVALVGGGLDWDSYDLYLIGAGANDASLTGLVLSNAFAINTQIDGAGTNAFNCAVGICTFQQGFAGDVSSNPVRATSTAGNPARLSTLFNSFGPMNGASTAAVLLSVNGGAAVNYTSMSDQITSNGTGGGASGIGLSAPSGSTANIFGGNWDVSGVATSTGISSGGTVNVCGATTIKGSSFDVATSGSGVFRETCPNTYGSGKFSLVSNSWFEGLTLAQANLTAQAGNIAATTLFTTPTNVNANTYVLTYDIKMVTAGTAGTITVNLGCPSATFAQPGPSTLAVTAAANSEASGVITCQSTAATAIQYSVTGITTPGTLSYNLNLRLDPK
jgi:hypothetical protein